MKIRIKGNSVRLRLTKTEVEAFNKEGKYLETVQFANKAFTYVLKAKEGITSLESDYDNDTITVYFPEQEKHVWATSDRVGYSNDVDWNDPTVLSILVEKDFTCLDNTIEDQSNNYPNPKLL
ncbi:hypothetical protein KIM67_01545 [Flagellimonas sp. 389]|uniref:DUF7009 family protein n=1 Tax=Flagellimonas sp. 389 TaxID=2835862 RepID=UPI001BD35004|nr:hypothetical protein [Flagellimonas sp. 389]MBS9461076.1 hypothetical protein [Flagellimonas sp. 389]